MPTLEHVRDPAQDLVPRFPGVGELAGKVEAEPLIRSQRQAIRRAL